MSLIQNNDQEIVIPVTLDGSDFDVSGITSATYKLYTRNKDTELLTKELNSGITRSANVLKVKLAKEDTKDLRGTHYHELAIADPIEGLSTVFKESIYFEPTEI